MGMLDGKVALVTGAARGTGAATARLFAAEGGKVVLGDVAAEAAQVVAKEIGDAARFASLDVTSEQDWQAAVKSACEEFGGLDVLVNNAGVLHMAAIGDTELADFERVVRINQIGTFLGIKSVIDPMKAAGKGSIVNISSIDGRTAKNGLMAYCASKWAVRGMTRVAALELGRWGIRVNAVCPEAGSAEMVKPYLPEGIDAELALKHAQPYLITQKRRSIEDRVMDVARMILFLASDWSASCSGADFAVDGGNTAGKVLKMTPGGW